MAEFQPKSYNEIIAKFVHGSGESIEYGGERLPFQYDNTDVRRDGNYQNVHILSNAKYQQ